MPLALAKPPAPVLVAIAEMVPEFVTLAVTFPVKLLEVKMPKASAIFPAAVAVAMIVPVLVTLAVVPAMPMATATPTAPVLVALAVIVPAFVTLAVLAPMPKAWVAVPEIAPVFVLVTVRVAVSLNPVGLPDRVIELVQVWLVPVGVH